MIGASYVNGVDSYLFGERNIYIYILYIYDYINKQTFLIRDQCRVADLIVVLSNV